MEETPKAPEGTDPIVVEDPRTMLARLLHHADQRLIASLLRYQAEGRLENLPQALKGAWETNFQGLRDIYVGLVGRALGDDVEIALWVRSRNPKPLTRSEADALWSKEESIGISSKAPLSENSLPETD